MDAYDPSTKFPVSFKEFLVRPPKIPKSSGGGIFSKFPVIFSPGNLDANRPANPLFIDGNVDWMHSENSLFSCVGNFRCKQLKTLVDFKMKIARRGIFFKIPCYFSPRIANRPANPPFIDGNVDWMLRPLFIDGNVDWI